MGINTLNEKLNFKRDLKGFYCQLPFKNLELHLHNKAFLCCPSWLNKSIGNFKEESIQDIWNSKSAQDIRESILDGSYQYCNHETCPLIQGNRLSRYVGLPEYIKDVVRERRVVLDNGPESVMFNHDQSCNLSCPSCRSEKISHSYNSIEYENMSNLTRRITSDLLKNPHQLQVINITGSGDPFASLSFRHFLENIDGKKYPNLKFDLQTNGLLLTPIMWERVSKIHTNIRQICVSIDAATKDTYLQVRRLGNWEILLDNMKMLCELRAQHKIKMLQVNFVVQQKNYTEIPMFADMFIKMGCDSIFFSLIVDWGSMSENEFVKSQIYKNDHWEYDNFISVLSHPILKHKKVNLGNLTSYRELAIIIRNNNLPVWKKIKIITFEKIYYTYRKGSKIFFTLKRVSLEKVSKYKKKWYSV